MDTLWVFTPLLVLAYYTLICIVDD